MIALIGWAADSRSLRELGFAGIPMMPAVAICIQLLAVALWMAARPSRSTVYPVLALAIAAGTFAFQAALQSVLGLSFGTDLWFFRNTLLALPQGAIEFPGRMSGAAMLMIFLTAIVMATASPGHDRLRRTFVTALSAGLLTAVACGLGLWLGSASFSSMGFYFVPAPATVVALTMLLCGAAVLRPDVGWMPALIGRSRTAKQTRFLLGWLVVMPTVLAGLARKGVDDGWYDWQTALALVVLGTIGLLASHVLWSALETARIQRESLEQKRALRSTEAQLHTARSISRIVSWKWTPEHKVWSIDDPIQVLKPPQIKWTMSHLDFSALIDDRDLVSFEAALSKCQSHGSATWEFRYRHPDGGIRWLLTSAWTEQLDADVTLQGVLIDITNQKEYELDIAASEYRLRLAMTALHGFIYDWDVDAKLVARSGRFHGITGFEPAEADATPSWWDSRIHPEDLTSAVSARLCALQSESKTFDSEYRIIRKDGTIIWVSEHVVFVRDSQGRISRVVGNVLDVTDRKMADLRNAENLHHLELAAQAADVGMWTWDLTANNVAFSSHCQRLLAVSPAELTEGPPQQFFNFLPRRFRRLAEKFVKNVRARGEFPPVEFEFQRGDGAVRWGQCRGIVLKDGVGQPTRVIGALRDVTRRVDMERERESLLMAERAARTDISNAARQKDEFLAMVSHELRTPLNAIMGWVLLMRRPNVSPQTLQDGLRVVDRNATVLAKLLADLFDADRLVSGKFTFEFAAVDLNDIATQVVQSLITVASEKRVKLRLVVSSEPVLVNGDPARLQQSLANVVHNAIKFTPADGSIVVQTACQHDDGIVTVVDSGEGIAEQFLPHIFEKFRQAEGGTARRHAGLGLGLALVKQFIESHGGRVTATSRGIGRGTTVTLSIPLLTTANNAAPDDDSGQQRNLAPLADNSVHDKRILVIEDESDAREYITRILQEHGAEVTGVGSVAEALRLLTDASTPFDLLISDIGMPGASGYDLIARLRDEFGIGADRLPAIALTAFTREEDVAKSIAKGFQAHLAKPLNMADLFSTIRRLQRQA